MFRQKMLLGSILCALLLTFSLNAFAVADCSRKGDLAVTAAGAALDISGKVEVRARGNRQRFKLSMDARVAEGTTFAVYANGNLAGTITINAFGDGEIELANDAGKVLPAAITPVCSIQTVEVRDGNGVAVLSGTF